MTDTAPRHLATILPALLAAIAVGATISTGDYRAATLAGIYALLAIGNLPAFGRLGLMSFAQGAFFGLGAYSVAYLSTWPDLPLALSFLAAIVVPVLVAVTIALPLRRLDLPLFPLVTLAATHLLWLTASRFGAPAMGEPHLATVTEFGTFWFSLVWVLVVLGGLFIWRMSQGAYGRLTEIARDNALASGAAGVDSRRLRLQGFALSAGYGGIAGALWALIGGAVDASAFGLPIVMVCLAAQIAGGRLYITGTIAGAVLMALIPAWLGIPAPWEPLLWAIAAFVALVLLPDGLAGILHRRFDVEPEMAAPDAQPLKQRKSVRIAGPLLAARGITRRFGGIVAVDNVSLALQPGEILGVIGPNGSGKTTLINALSGFSAGDIGRVFLAGFDITGVPPHTVARAGLARSFQVTQLADRVSVLDNVAASRVALAGAGFGSIFARGHAETVLQRARAQAMSCITAVGLADEAATAAGDLSSSARRKLEVARALALDPLVVAFDEPSAGLDAAERETLARLLLSLAARGIGLIVIEHDVAFLRQIAHRLACLDAGRLIAIGPTETVVADPKVLAAYLGAPPPTVRERRR